jgi:hypothetical protein
MTPAEIQAAITAADQILKGINDKINATLSNVIIKALPVVGDVLKFIHDRVADVSHAIERIVGSITSTVGGAIQNLLPSAVEFLTGIANDIFNDVHNILGNLATAEEVVGGAINEIRKHAGPFADFVGGAISSALSFGLTDVLKFLEGQDRATVDHFLDTILESKSLPPWLHTMVAGLRGRGAEWQALALPLLVGVLLQPIGGAMVNPLLVELKQVSNATWHTQELDPSALVELRLKELIGAKTFHDAMAANNLNAARADAMVKARQERLLPDQLNTLRFRGQITDMDAYVEAQQRGLTADRLDRQRETMRPILSEDEVRQTFLRGIIDRPKHDALLELHGYKPEVIDRKVRLYYLIPGPQDLIHMGIRNVFDPQIVEKFNLAQDAPKEFFAAAAMQGISEDWAAKFWQAHWIVPGIDQAFEMYQRVTDNRDDPDAETLTLLDGTRVQNIISRNTLHLFLKDKDVPPYYRDRLTQIAYHPLNRIDVRRMYSVGSLTKAGVERAYLNLGYNPTNARALADFVERYYAQAKKDKAQPIIDGLRRQILRLYQQGKLELSDASFALTDLNFTADEAAYFLKETDLIQQAETATLLESGIGRLYAKGYTDEPGARDRLKKAGVPAMAIEQLIAKWNLQLELNQDNEHFHKARDLTLSQVIEAYVDGQMTRDVAEGYVELLGYPANAAAILLAEADYRQMKATRTATQDALKALYVNGIRDALTTSNDLDTLGLPSQRRDALIAEWTLLRETRTEKIPIATLRDMYKKKILSQDDVFAHLKRHRYTDDDAKLMLQFWNA